MGFHLAQINIAKMQAPLDSPVMAEFVASLGTINALAERSTGFIWRLKDDTNNATSIKIFDDDFVIVNMSVWENKDMLFRFVYQSNHVALLRRRKEWFEKMTEMHLALWYIQKGSVPTVAEALERLNYIKNHGESPYAFSFKTSFSAEEAEKYISVK